MFWLIKMIESGCPPKVIARRMLCIASEDIGNADPRALSMALNAWDAFERLGMPEGMLALSQATIYLAVAPKSNSVYKAYKSVLKSFDLNKNIDVPGHLKNFQTTNSNHEYKYPHDYEHAYVKQQYFPDGMKEQYYYPSERGLEYKIKKKIDFLNSI
jgi:putative ATPase